MSKTGLVGIGGTEYGNEDAGIGAVAVDLGGRDPLS
jgi:hypothetical protein